MPVIDFNKVNPLKIDYDKVNAIALHHAETVLAKWMPGGKVINHEYVCAGLSGGRGTSCSTNLTTGVGSDFATGEKWGDMIDFVAKCERISMHDAAILLEDFLNISETTPVPAAIKTWTKEEKRSHAMTVSAGFWSEGEDCPPNHPYLLKKQINSDPGIRYHPSTGNLLIPLRDGTDLLGVQRIDASGEKKVNHGGMLAGCYHVIQGEHDVVYICEGYATAMTVAMVTGKTSVMAVSAGNLLEVGKKIRTAYPSAYIIFAADNDQGKDKNPGVESATKACEQISKGSVVYPPFPDGQKGDWNDFAVQNGAKATKELLTRPMARKQLFLSIADYISQPIKIDYLIHKIIEINTTNSTFGPSGSGKSFIELDKALCIATGRPWAGHKIIKPGGVLIMAGEGRKGVIRRVKAWAQHHNIDPSDLKNVFMSKHTLMMDGSNINAICDEVAGLDISYVLIDTLARHIDGNENDTADMSAFVRYVDELRDRLNTTITIIHHTGVNDTTRGRGNGALKGALDSEILCKDGVLEWTKTKDMETPDAITFGLHPVEIGEDEDGEIITSCVAVYGEQAAKSSSMKLNAHEKDAVEALVNVCVRDGYQNAQGQYVASIEEWREEFYELRRLQEPEVKVSALKKSFQRVRGSGEKDAGLKAKGIVDYSREGVILIRPDEQVRVNFERINITKGSGTSGHNGTCPVNVPSGHDGTLTGHVPPD